MQLKKINENDLILELSGFINEVIEEIEIEDIKINQRIDYIINNRG